jgi:hypothetical protein
LCGGGSMVQRGTRGMRARATGDFCPWSVGSGAMRGSHIDSSVETRCGGEARRPRDDGTARHRRCGARERVLWPARHTSPSSQRDFTTFKLEIFKWNSNFSKKQSFRSKYRLQLSQRVAWCLSKGSVGNICESWSVAECRESVSNCIDQDFEQFPLKI